MLRPPPVSPLTAALFPYTSRVRSRGPLSHLAPGARVPERRLAQLRRVGELRTACFCYDHLAGRLGVALTDSRLQRRYLRREAGDFRLGPKGRAFLEGLGIDVAAAAAERRHFARCCLDWSERRQIGRAHV